MLISLVLTVLLLGIAIWRKGFGLLVWIDLFVSALNLVIFLVQIGL